MLDAMGSEATDAEADAMLAIIRKLDVEDTRGISDDDWRKYMDQAIAEAAK